MRQAFRIRNEYEKSAYNFGNFYSEIFINGDDFASRNKNIIYININGVTGFFIELDYRSLIVLKD